ncbi:restriction endonuclease subunit S [Streptomyces sp. NPDC051104]|uniref:restriction endonuclease subunit S n=1 Tax=Streptomyces sp. NPDC051104 TaxID=3155044 RepID=UPI00343DBC63
MSEWTSHKLADLIDIKHGFAFKGEYFGEDPDGPILVTPGNFAIGGGFKEGKPKSYTGPIPEGFTLSEGDLVVTMTDLSKAADTLGYAGVIPGGKKYLHNQRIGKVAILKPGLVEKGFLHYALRTDTYRSHVVGGATGTTVKHTSPTRIGQYALSLPPVAEQQAIAAVLRALDDKITVNERIAATVNELAGALFQGCFERSPRLITDVASITMGQSPPGETYNERGDGLPFYQGTRDFGMRYPRHRVWCTAVTRYAYENDVLVSVRAPVGEINVAAEECGIGRGVAAVRSVQYPHVLLHALSSDRSVWRPYEAEGTVFGSINKKQFSQLELSWPSEQSIDGLESQLKALDDRLRQATEESRTLATLRDTLLPQLMSGRLRVKYAEKIVEDHT